MEWGPGTPGALHPPSWVGGSRDAHGSGGCTSSLHTRRHSASLPPAPKCFFTQHYSSWKDLHFKGFLKWIWIDVYFQGVWFFFFFSFCHFECLWRRNNKQKPHTAKPQITNLCLCKCDESGSSGSDV